MDEKRLREIEGDWTVRHQPYKAELLAEVRRLRQFAGDFDGMPNDQHRGREEVCPLPGCNCSTCRARRVLTTNLPIWDGENA